ncbi:hypothetical protein BCON_0036g00520 [Botryotinia convoluta]|uniref:Uncharacterized protein n=1 Tax=Botryotinia convoluta TaxID=54673 RepID=A0A4Z1IFE9_9HELO|nr:hypothetical protein BCON_0036g00520 [Botryotinia convoluta]
MLLRNGVIIRWQHSSDWLTSPYEAQGQNDMVQAVALSSDNRILVSCIVLFASGPTTWGHSEIEHSVWTLQKIFSMGECRSKLVLSQDHQYFQINKGPLWVDPLFMGGSSPKRTDSSNIQVKRNRIEWGPPDERKTIQLPPEYRPLYSDIYDNTLVMGHASGRATCRELT